MFCVCVCANGFHEELAFQEKWNKAQYVAVRQCDGHHVLCVDLQRAHCLSRSSVFSLDSKLGDEPVDAVRQEPGDHDKCVVLCKRCQVGDEARSCRGNTQK